MDVDTYRGVLAAHELVEFDYIKRRVGSHAILASQEDELPQIGFDALMSLPDEEYARLRALDEDNGFINTATDPVQDAELAFGEEVHQRFGMIEGYLLSNASVDHGLSLVRILHSKEDSAQITTITLMYFMSPDGTPVTSKTLRATGNVRETLEVTEDDKRILEQAFDRLTAITEDLKDA